MNRILLVVGLLLGIFPSFAADGSKNFKADMPFQVDTMPVSCRSPEGLFASARDTIASLNWLSRGANMGYSVKWKLKNDTDWKTVDVTQNTYLLRGIKSCSEYEFRVKTLCGITGMSEYSESKKFKTLGCIAPCITPREIAHETGENKATFKWNPTNSRAYEVQIKDASNNGDWRTEVVSGNAFMALNLRPCTKYFFRVRSICTEATSTTPIMFSEWSTSITVATTGCPTPCLAPRKIYYSSTATSAVIKWDSTRGATYELQVMGPRDIVWRTISGITRPFHELSGLPNCTIYQARVRVKCSATSTSAWSYVIRFKTGGCQPICIKPAALKVYVADSIAVFSWVARNGSKFVFQYKTDTDVNWKSLNVTGNVYILTGLDRCKKYIARIQSVCSSTSSSDFSNAVKFETGCRPACARPSDLKSDIVLDSVAILYWTGTAGNYEIQYRRADWGENDWKSVRVGSPAHKLILERCKGYYWRVRKLCDNNTVSDWSELGKFETKGCDNPQRCEIPRLKVELVADSIIHAVWSGSQSKFEIQYRVISPNEGDWISEKFEGVYEAKLKLHPCKVYQIHIRALCHDGTLSNWSEIQKIETKGCANICAIPRALKSEIGQDTIVYLAWAGLAGIYEIQYQLAGATDWRSVKVQALEHKLILPKCNGYYWRVRRICDNGVSDWSELAKFETKGCLTVCTAPKDLKFELFQDSIVALYWNGANALKFEVQYRLTTISNAEWKSEFVATPAHKLQLHACQIYEWRVRGFCPNGETDWVYGNKILTKGCLTPTICPVPLDLKVKTDGTLAYVLWNDTYARDSVFVQYRKATETAWSDVVLVGTTPNGVILRGLENCKAYIVRARRKCASGLFSDWKEAEFKLAVNCFIDNGDVISNSLLRKVITDATVYPNPGNGYVQVDYNLTETADVKVQIINVQGQVVKQLDNSIQDAGNYMQVLDNLGDIQQGLYFIIIRTDGKVSLSQKWIKE